jgi:hypothetical protein
MARRRREDERSRIEWLEDIERRAHELTLRLTDTEWSIVENAAELLYHRGRIPPYGKAASLFLVRGIIEAQREAVALSQRGEALLSVQSQMLALPDPIHGNNGDGTGRRCPACGALARKAGRPIARFRLREIAPPKPPGEPTPQLLADSGTDLMRGMGGRPSDGGSSENPRRATDLATLAGAMRALSDDDRAALLADLIAEFVPETEADPEPVAPPSPEPEPPQRRRPPTGNPCPDSLVGPGGRSFELAWR